MFLISGDKGVLCNAGVDLGLVYDVALLTLPESKQLFNHHAFSMFLKMMNLKIWSTRLQ